ncbi:MAG: nitroreductase family protein [Chloroflexota bacterium]
MSTRPEPIHVLEAIATTRSMRRLKTDPIPDEVLRSILEAATRAPSGSNQQTWSFIVVRDPDLKKAIQRIYHEVAQNYFETAPRRSPGKDGERVMSRVRSSAAYLAEHLHEAPALVFCCIRGEPRFGLGASIYPAVQNLMLAARAYGIGSTLTTFHMRREDEIKQLLDIPDEVHTAALIPLGYPTGRWRRGPRRPLEDVVFADRFGVKMWDDDDKPFTQEMRSASADQDDEFDMRSESA